MGSEYPSEQTRAWHDANVIEAGCGVFRGDGRGKGPDGSMGYTKAQRTEKSK